MSITVTSRLHAIARSGRSATGARAVMSVPGSPGRRAFTMRTGIPRATAGRIVLGCSTFAPKYASSDASANDRCGTRRAAGTTRGSAVSIPATSVQM